MGKRVDISVMSEVAREFERACVKHPGGFHSAHEGYAVLLEEVDELWTDIKSDDIEHSRIEALHVAAMAIKYVMAVCDKTKWDKEEKEA